MKLQRYNNNPILERNLKNSWEAGSVFNPCVIYDEGKFRMFYRATSSARTKNNRNDISSIGYAESEDGFNFKRFSEPLISPDKEYESGLGCEDPRVTKIGDEYFLFYTAVKGIDDLEVNKDVSRNRSVLIALATSKDLKNWTKHGIVGPQFTRSKAACLFPEKIDDKYVMLYTWNADRPTSSIMQARFDSLEDLKSSPEGFMADNIDCYWDNVVFEPPKSVYRGPEVGACPIKTKEGWLFIYCGANTSGKPEWTINAALLDTTYAI